MSYTTKLELRDALLSILQNYNLTQSCINQLLSDVFIDGAFELIQNEPENDDFMSFVKSFSENQNLYSIADAQDKIATELCQEGYFTNIFQYVIDAWRDIDISADSISLNLMTNNNDEEDITPEDVKKANIITNIAMKILNIPNPAKAVVNEFFLWGKITVAVNNQDKKFYDIADRFRQELLAVATGARGAFTTAESTTSPLVVDLDGDGVETTTVESGVYFDHDDNGFAEKSGWVGKDDGLLVRDINNNGLIDDGTELFGNNTVLSNGQKATNGFEALKDLDSNNNNVFDSSDTAWNQVKVWKDANQNGKVDSGELLSLVSFLRERENQTRPC